MFSKKIKTIIYIEKMSCSHCASKVKTALEEIEDIKKVKVDLSQKKATLLSSQKIDNNILKEKIENLGYEVKSILTEEK